MSGNNQQMNVQWNNHLQSLRTEFPRMLSGQRFVDVTLACERRRIHCHRVVLAACSPYFQELLEENPTQHPIIILPKDVKFWAVEALVEFMYRGEVSISQDRIDYLIKCAEILEIRGLKRISEEPVLIPPLPQENKEDISPEVPENPPSMIEEELKIETIDVDSVVSSESEEINPGHSSWNPATFNSEESSRLAEMFTCPPETPPKDFFIPKNLKRSYSREDMWNALMSVKNGVSVQRAAKDYKIPVGTLHSFMRRYGIQSCHLSYQKKSLIRKNKIINGGNKFRS